MRIAQVVASYHPRIGGLETHVLRLAQGCAAAGDEVTVLTHQVDGSPADESMGAVRVLRFPLTVQSRNYPFSQRLFRHVRLYATDYDIVHVHNYHTLNGHAAIGTGRPFVFTPHYHGTGHTLFRAFLHRVYRPVGRRQFSSAEAIVCVSDAEREIVVRHFPEVERKLVVIPNGIDLRRSKAGEDRGRPKERIVLTVGRLERYKNIDLIIDAFRSVSVAATLVVVGEGPDRARLESYAAASGANLPVIFTGSISAHALDRWFGRAQVVTSASEHESFGLTLAEGLASGARVVASGIPAHASLRNLAGPGGTVDLIDPRNTAHFAERLTASLLADQHQPVAVTLPSWTQVVQMTRELYARVSHSSTEFEAGSFVAPHRSIACYKTSNSG